MITKCSISNFKCFENIELEKISPITIIGGKNSVGKSTLLEALFLPIMRVSPEFPIRPYQWRGVHSISTDHRSLFAPIFYAQNLKKNIKIKTQYGNATETLLVKYDSDYIVDNQPTSQPAISTVLNLKQKNVSTLSGALRISYSIEDGNTDESVIYLDSQGRLAINFSVELFQRHQRYGIILPSRIPVSSSEDCEKFGKLDVENKEGLILDVLKIIEPTITDLSVINTQGISGLYAKSGKMKKLPVQLMGDGLSRLVSLSLAIATTPDGVVFIDEIENGIHHSKQENIWNAITQLAEKVNCQIIATTHSYEFLSHAHNALKDSLADKFSYIRLDRKDGIISPNVYSHEELGAALDYDLEVR